jgi:hypothetical protein
LPGAVGGGGGGGGASVVDLITGERNDGGKGGHGGLGGLPGASGLGGEGGGGGGGIQLLVRGLLNMAPGAAVLAVGGNGGAGQAGGAGGAGTAGTAGEIVPGSSFAGSGGNGGTGGNGGNGGAGGHGTGGTGGVVQIAASGFTFNGYTDVSGGRGGDGATESAHGASYFKAFSGSGVNYNSPTYFGIGATGSNPYRSFSTAFTFDGQPIGQVPNLPSVLGGAAPYGLLTGETAAPGVTPLTVAEGVKLFAELAAPPVPGHKRVGAVTRVDAEWIGLGFGVAGFDSSNRQQVILFSAFSDVAQPALMVKDPAHQAFLGDYIPAGPLALRQGNGYLNDPTITPGAVAPTDLTTLTARSTFAMYASGTQNVTAAFTPYSAPRLFTGTPTPAGNFGAPGASAVFLEDRGLLSLRVTPRSGDTGATGTIASSRETTGNFESPVLVFARAGGDNRLRAQVQGIGNDGTATFGTVEIRSLQATAGGSGAPGPLATQATETFSQVGVGQTWDTASYALQTKGLALGTTQRVAEIVFKPDYDDTTRTITAPVDAMIFGPTPRLQGVGTNGNSFTFASIQAGTAVTSRFSLQNADTVSSLGFLWELAVRAQPELIRLTVLGYELVDPSGVFSLNGLGNAPIPFTLDGNQTAPIDLRFSPMAAGQYTGTLRLLTDMNAPLGQAGDIFAVNLFAAAVDEPPALLLLLGGGLALLLRHRRRDSRSAH